jgi:hypothetical protein
MSSDFSQGSRAGQNNRNGALKLSPFLFRRAVKASLDVRHLNVVDVVSWVNELSLLRGLLLAALFGLFSGLLLSCHIVVSPS